MAKQSKLSPAEEMAAIRQQLGQQVFDKPVRSWLDTGSKRLNSVLGSEELGLAYGRMIELFGPNSNGKTMLALFLCAVAQSSGADVAWVDLEQSYDEDWIRSQGIDPEKVYLFEVEVIKSKGEKEERLETAQELFTRIELWMKRRQQQDPEGRRIVVVDSLAAILVEEEAEAGLTGQNMRTNAALAAFLSKMLRQWVAKVANYNTMVVLINQVRASFKMFSNPETTSGGNAYKHYCSVRCRVQRVGTMKQGTNVVGLRGVIKNIKNKAGAGSREGNECGYETRFGTKSWKFPSVKEVRAENKGE